MANPKAGDYGLVLERTMVDSLGDPIDVSTATVIQLLLTAPDGTTSTKTGAFSSDGSDGKVLYVTVDGDLDDYGHYQGQFRLTFPSRVHTADAFHFTVDPALDTVVE